MLLYLKNIFFKQPLLLLYGKVCPSKNSTQYNQYILCCVTVPQQLKKSSSKQAQLKNRHTFSAL